MAKGLSGTLVFFLFGSPLIAQELPLDQAVQLALKHNVDVANSALDVSKALDRSRAFHTQLFPKLSFYALGSEQLTPVSFTVGAGTLEQSSPIGPIPSHDVQYTTPVQPTGYLFGRIVQPISPIYRIRLNLKALDYSTQLAQQKERSKRQDVVRNVKQLYYNIEQVQSSLAATQETVRLYKEIERITRDYVLKQTALEYE